MSCHPSDLDPYHPPAILRREDVTHILAADSVSELVRLHARYPSGVAVGESSFLTLALLEPAPRCLTYCLESAAVWSATDVDRTQPIDMAIRLNNLEVAERLIRTGHPISRPTVKRAILTGNSSLVSVLVQNGGDARSLLTNDMSAELSDRLCNLIHVGKSEAAYGITRSLIDHGAGRCPPKSKFNKVTRAWEAFALLYGGRRLAEGIECYAACIDRVARVAYPGLLPSDIQMVAEEWDGYADHLHAARLARSVIEKRSSDEATEFFSLHKGDNDSVLETFLGSYLVHSRSAVANFEDLISWGLPIHYEDAGRSNLLSLLAMHGRKELAVTLAKAGANVWHVNAYGESAVDAALSLKSPGLYSKLVCFPRKEEFRSTGTFSRAIREQRNPHWKRLLAAKENPNWRDPGNGRSALSEAIYYDQPEFIDQLISGGAAIDAQENDGRTALHHAASKNAETAVKTLLRMGARTDLQNRDGKTPSQTTRNIELAMMIDASERQARIAAELSADKSDTSLTRRLDIV